MLYTRVLVSSPLIGSVTIRLKDENDHTPTFDVRSIVVSVVKSESGSCTIAEVQAFDRDIDDQNKDVKYYLNKVLSDPEVVGNFDVESTGTIRTSTTFGQNTNKTFYRLFITAFNDAPAWNSNTTHKKDFQLDVQVISVNEKLPGKIFNSHSLNMKINRIIFI